MKTSKKDLLKRITRNITLALGLFYGGTQLAYIGNDVINSHNPSKQRKEFKEEFGFPIGGWKSDIEEKPHNLITLAETIHKEMLEKPFELRLMTIASNNLLKESFFQQLSNIILDRAAFYSPISNKIEISTPIYSGVIHHEIKHAKIDDILEEYPEFIEKWEALAKDESGNSLYLGRDWDEKNRDLKEDEKLGFVSSYSRRNSDEDIAELCSWVEWIPGFFQDWLSEGKKGNPKIKAKVKLAEEYGLIPAEFQEYTKLNKLYIDSVLFDSHTEEFLKKSEKFLKKHPETTYELDIRNTRARVIKRKTYETNWGLYENREEYNKIIKEVIKELTLGLTASYKPKSEYVLALSDLSSYYWDLNDKKRSTLYNSAIIEYAKRLNQGDIKIVKKGVNDYLIANGEKLE